MSTNTDYLNIISSFKNLTDIGLLYETNVEDYQERRKNLENQFDEFNTCCEWINKFSYHPSDREFKKLSQLQSYSSYYLKHLVEKWSGKYISNGALIAAVRFFKIPYRQIYGTPDISVAIFLKRKATL
jgi:hypothetical protein